MLGTLILLILAAFVGYRFYKRITATLYSYKSILITGAAGGIGSGLALKYANQGVSLVLSDVEQAKGKLESVAKECEAKGATVITKTIDVTDKVAMEKWLLEVDDQVKFDLIIANAGVAEHMLEGLSANDRYRRVVEVNLFGVMNTVLPLIDGFQQRKSGQIAVVSSLAAYIPNRFMVGYSTSKAAAKMFGQCVYDWMVPHGVGVSTIHPYFIKTNMTVGLPKKMTWGMIELSEAIDSIHNGLARKDPLIAFPHTFAWLVYLRSIAPIEWFLGGGAPSNPRFGPAAAVAHSSTAASAQFSGSEDISAADAAKVQ